MFIQSRSRDASAVNRMRGELTTVKNHLNKFAELIPENGANENNDLLYDYVDKLLYRIEMMSKYLGKDFREED
jgi:hypothetical protein